MDEIATQKSPADDQSVPPQRPLHVVVMGVSGCGKSTVGELLASRLGLRYIEGDQFHSDENRARMHRGVALTDEDRREWLQTLHALMQAARGGVVLSCSALRRSYRDYLRSAVPELHFVFLDISPEDARARVAARSSHFFSAKLVDSQFATLESPVGEAGVHAIDASLAPRRIVDEALASLEATRGLQR